MKNIRVSKHYYHIKALYQKANTKTQRALLGYMVKAGLAADPVYGGAFHLVRDIESYHGVYILETEVDAESTKEIISIAENAMLGVWDDFAFSEREINTILNQFGYLEGKGGK